MKYHLSTQRPTQGSLLGLLRYYEHREDTKKEEERTKTALSTHIWGLKDKNIQHKVEWKIKYRGPDFSPLTKKCRICLKENHYIM